MVTRLARWAAYWVRVFLFGFTDCEWTNPDGGPGPTCDEPWSTP